jgi:hypothetical protein
MPNAYLFLYYQKINYVTACIYTTKAIIGKTAPKTHIFRNLLQECDFWLTPNCSGTQLGHKGRAICIWDGQNDARIPQASKTLPFQT